MAYKVTVKFDDLDQDTIAHNIYFNALQKYDALGVGHDNGTSTMFILSDRLDRKKLVKDLGDLEIISIEKY